MYAISKINWLREYWTLNTYLQLVFSFVIRVKLLSRHSSFIFIRLKGSNCKQIIGEKAFNLCSGAPAAKTKIVAFLPHKRG